MQVLQLFAVGLPVLTQIWLARSLGAAEYGRFVFVVALTSYFVLLCDFGFGWSASRSIAIHRDDERRCGEIVCATLFAKAGLFLLCVVLLGLLVATIEQLFVERVLLAVALVSVLGSVLSPSWYFIGTERAHIGFLADVAGKLVSAVLVVALVRDARDVLVGTAAVSVGALAGGLLGLLLIVRERKVRWSLPPVRQVLATMKGGVPLFISSSAVSLYTALNALVLGFVSTREEVAYFGAAHRIVSAGSIALGAFHQVFYPRISRELHHRPASAMRTLVKALLSQGMVGLLCSLGLFVFAEPLTLLLFGESLQPAADCLRWMAAIPVTLAVATVFSNFVIMGVGRDALHLAMTLAAAMVNVLVLIAFGRQGGAVGAGIALLAAEVFVLIYSVAVGGFLLKRMVGIAANAPEAT